MCRIDGETGSVRPSPRLVRTLVRTEQLADACEVEAATGATAARAVDDPRMIGHDRNQTTKVADQSAHHTGGESFNRSRTGGASSGVEPRLPNAVCRGVRSSNCRESTSNMAKKPLSLQRLPLRWHLTC